LKRPWTTSVMRLLTIYVVWSITWVFLSDLALRTILPHPEHDLFWSVQMLKGLIYIATTTIILGLAVRAQQRENERLRLIDQSKLRSIQAANLIGIATWCEKHVLEANDAFLKMLGYSRDDVVFGRINASELIAPESWQVEQQARHEVSTTGRSRIFEEELIRKDGTRVRVIGGRSRISGSGEKALGIAYLLDITELRRAEYEQKQLEEELQRTRQLNALGQLAGGIAHDFNNLLSVMIGYTALLEAGLPEDDPRRESTTEVLKAADKGKILVRKLLKFSQKDSARPALLDVNHELSELQKILERIIGDSVQLRLVLGEHVGCVLADSTQFEQIIMNLVVNARDAMPGGGTVTIETSKAHIETEAGQMHDVTPGEYVVIRVKDTGVGMEQEVRKRIFEPFFSTKKHAGGTGMGLAIVYGAVKQNGGAIRVDSQPGRGTEFKVFLPWAAERPESEAIGAGLGVAPGGTETILVLEDNEELRTMLAAILRGFGYTVISAQDGRQGVSKANEYQGRIDLVLADISMPHLSGPQAVEQIRRRRPEVKALLMTGFADPAFMERQMIAGASILEKPTTPDALARSVREALKGGQTQAA
jgi:two-component system, cell cycle sensor histidine kinase and response regulator CckA